MKKINKINALKNLIKKLKMILKINKQFLMFVYILKNLGKLF